MKSRVGEDEYGEASGILTVLLHKKNRLSADLAVCAGRTSPAPREWLVGHPDKFIYSIHLGFPLPPRVGRVVYWIISYHLHLGCKPPIPKHLVPGRMRE